MRDCYRYSIIYFTVFALLLLLSGVWLFSLKMGVNYAMLEQYYLGSEARFMQPKSYEGLLEVTLPHVGAVGLFIMVTAHFILFTPQRERRMMFWLTALWFLSAVGNIAAPFAIVAGWHAFTGVKLMAFMLFELLGFYILWVVFNAAFRGLDRPKKSADTLW